MDLNAKKELCISAAYGDVENDEDLQEFLILVDAICDAQSVRDLQNLGFAIA